MDDIDAILKSSAAPAAAAPAPIASAVPAQQEPAAFAAGIPKPTYKPIVFDVKNGGGDSKSAAGGGAKGGKACYECGKEGHQARNCPNKDGAAAPAAGSGKACYECGKEGHQARNCPNKAGGAAAPAAGPGGNCFNCNKPNHKAKDCTAPKAAGGGGGGGAAPKACHICGRTNHLARECRFAGDKKAGGGGGGGAVSGGAFGTGPRLYVGNLSYQTSWQSLKDHFRRVVQTVHRCDVLLQSDGKSKGCAIVEVGSQADLTAALLLTDTELDGRKIFVRLDREEAGAFGGAGGGGGGGGAVFSKKSAYAGSGRDRAGSSDGGTSIYVGNLAFGVSWQSLKDLFASYGDVLRADVIADNSGKSKGFGIVKMSTKKEANKAIGM